MDKRLTMLLGCLSLVVGAAIIGVFFHAALFRAEQQATAKPDPAMTAAKDAARERGLQALGRLINNGLVSKAESWSGKYWTEPVLWWSLNRDQKTALLAALSSIGKDVREDDLIILYSFRDDAVLGTAGLGMTEIAR